MHMVISAIVYAPDEESAFDKAREVFERLCGENGQPFDYFSTFESAGSPMSGRGRWGSVVPIARADSKEGKRLIEEGMDATKIDFMRNLSEVRKALEGRSDEELFRKNDDMWRYYAHGLGEYTGSNIWLYDNDGSGIRTPNNLESVLSKYRSIYEDEGKENPHRDELVWVVPADVHF